MLQLDLNENEIHIPSNGGIGVMKNDDKALSVEFYDGTILDEDASIKAKRRMLKTATMIRIFVSPKHIIERPAKLKDEDDIISYNDFNSDENQIDINRVSDINRFPHAWKAYKQGTKDLYNGGVPLVQCGIIPENIVTLLEKNHKIYTLEQFVSTPTSQLKNIPKAGEYKDHAQHYLDQSGDRHIIEEQDNKIKELQRQMDEMKFQMNDKAEPTNKPVVDDKPVVDKKTANRSGK